MLKHYVTCCSFKTERGKNIISYFVQMHTESKMWDERLVEPERSVWFSLREHCQISKSRRGVADHFKSSTIRRNLIDVFFDSNKICIFL